MRRLEASIVTFGADKGFNNNSKNTNLNHHNKYNNHELLLNVTIMLIAIIIIVTIIILIVNININMQSYGPLSKRLAKNSAGLGARWSSYEIVLEAYEKP